VHYASAPDYINMQFAMEYNMQGSLQLNQLIYSGQYLVGLQTAKHFWRPKSKKT